MKFSKANSIHEWVTLYNIPFLTLWPSPRYSHLNAPPMGTRRTHGLSLFGDKPIKGTRRGMCARLPQVCGPAHRQLQSGPSMPRHRQVRRVGLLLGRKRHQRPSKAVPWTGHGCDHPELLHGGRGARRIGKLRAWPQGSVHGPDKMPEGIEHVERTADDRRDVPCI